MSVYFLLGLLVYLFLNADYIESSMLEKMLYVVSGCLSTSTVFTFYRNDVGVLWKTSLFFNLIFLLGGFIALSRIFDAEHSHLIWYSAFMVIFSGINLKSLYQLKSTSEFLNEIPYSFFVALVIASVYFLSEPYISAIARALRLFITIGLVAMMGWKFFRISIRRNK